jgi:hypothetical protein
MECQRFVLRLDVPPCPASIESQEPIIAKPLIAKPIAISRGICYNAIIAAA